MRKLIESTLVSLDGVIGSDEVGRWVILHGHFIGSVITRHCRPLTS